MDAYLINDGQGFSILYNKSNTLEAEVEAGGSRISRFAKNIPLYNLVSYAYEKAKPLLSHMPFRNILGRITEWSARIIQSSNGAALSAGSCSGQFAVHYADTMKDEEAKTAFYRVARKEIRRGTIAAAANLALVPIVGYNPVSIALPVPTSIIFLAGAGLSLGIRKKIKKNAKRAVFIPSREISELEKRVLGGNNRSAEDYFSEYDFT